MPMYRKLNKNFFKKWSRDMAYVLGFFSADGYLTVNKRGGQFWSIQINDKKLLQQIRKVIKSGHKISIKKKSGNEHISYRLQIGSIEMCEDLRRLGMRENKTKSLSVPNIPDKYFADFVRGYFDGDGNVWVGYKNKKASKFTIIIQTCFTSCSFKFLSNLKNKLEKLNITGFITKACDGNYYRLYYSVRSSLKLAELMYNSSSELLLFRKKCKFDKYKKMRS